MKIGIVIPNNLWFCPYVNIYTKLLSELNVYYEVVSWCRDGEHEDNCIEYTDSKVYSGPLKLISYLKFASFVKKTVVNRNYDKLIVFTPQTGVFIANFLKKHFKRNYIFDYRDLSIEQSAIFKKAFKTVLDNSAANVISSPGFKQYLPSGYEYILSHNFNIDAVRDALGGNSVNTIKDNEGQIDVLTIGGIRDFESNVEVLKSLGNKEGFTVRFVGRGYASEPLKQVSDESGFKNVSFVGFYKKEEEPSYVKDATFLNIFYPRKASHDTALSNRFYNSLIYRKPMITTADTTQGNYASKYGVGVAINDCSNLSYELKHYLLSDEYAHFAENANKLLNDFVKDYDVYYAMIRKFVNK